MGSRREIMNTMIHWLHIFIFTLTLASCQPLTTDSTNYQMSTQPSTDQLSLPTAPASAGQSGGLTSNGPGLSPGLGAGPSTQDCDQIAIELKALLESGANFEIDQLQYNMKVAYLCYEDQPVQLKQIYTEYQSVLNWRMMAITQIPELVVRHALSSVGLLNAIEQSNVDDALQGVDQLMDLYGESINALAIEEHIEQISNPNTCDELYLFFKDSTIDAQFNPSAGSAAYLLQDPSNKAAVCEISAFLDCSAVVQTFCI
jgi:hypothetical protein